MTDLFDLTPEKVAAMGERFKETAASVGLPFGDIRRVYNSRMAQEVGLWAADQGKGEAFHMAAFQAFFVRQENIAERMVILDLADAAGLPADEAAAVMEDRRYKAAVDRDWATAAKLEIDLIPTVVVGDYRQGGFQPYTRFEALMKNAGIARR